MPSTFLPSINPSYNASQFSVTQNLKTTKFGDGYEERKKDGISSARENYKLTWDNITGDELAELRTFFDNQAAYGASFYWQNFEGDTKLYYYTDPYDVNYVGYNAYSFSITIKETSA